MRRMRMLSMRLVLSAIIVSSFVVSSCNPKLHISMASSAERLPNPSFIVEDPSHPQQPRYYTVEVWDTTDGKETHQAKLVWKMIADPFDDRHGVAQLTYGKTLAGFKSVTDPAPLAVGRRYTIRVSGTGEGNLHFRIDRDGKLTHAS